MWNVGIIAKSLKETKSQDHKIKVSGEGVKNELKSISSVAIYHKTAKVKEEGFSREEDQQGGSFEKPTQLYKMNFIYVQYLNTKEDKQKKRNVSSNFAVNTTNLL